MCGKLWVTVPLVTFAYVFGAGFVQSQCIVTGFGTSVECVNGRTDSKLVGSGVVSCWLQVSCKCARLECVRVPFVKSKQW